LTKTVANKGEYTLTNRKTRLIQNTWKQSPMTGIGHMKQELQSKNHAQNYI